MYYSKTLISIVFLSALTLSGYSQTEKGNFLIGGGSGAGLSLTRHKQNSDSPDNYLSFSLYGGYFIGNNLLLGAELPASFIFSRNRFTNNIIIDPFIRFYFGESVIKPFITAKGIIGHHGYTIKNDGGEVISSGSSFVAGLGAGGGLGIFINEKISFEFRAEYENQFSNEDPFYDSYGIYSRFGIAVVL